MKLKNYILIIVGLFPAFMFGCTSNSNTKKDVDEIGNMNSKRGSCKASVKHIG